MILSVLDQSTVNDSMPQSQAIKETIELSKFCESLGYHRYWVSEHHNSQSVAGTAPEILVSAIAASTNKIRVGSAAVLLPYYSPYKVAEQFSVIEALAPGRIDLGIGRGAGADGLAARALNPNLNLADNYKNQITELLYWVEGRPLIDDKLSGHGLVSANPLGYTSPDVWIMGSGFEGAEIAAELGLPYSFAHFFSDGEGMIESLNIYKSKFIPSEKYSAPKFNVCVWALVSDTEDEAFYHARSRNHWRLDFLKSQRNPLINPEILTNDRYNNEELTLIKKWNSTAFVGDIDSVASKLEKLSLEQGIDEIVVNTWSYDFKIKIKSYELLSRLIK